MILGMEYISKYLVVGIGRLGWCFGFRAHDGQALVVSGGWFYASPSIDTRFLPGSLWERS